MKNEQDSTEKYPCIMFGLGHIGRVHFDILLEHFSDTFNIKCVVDPAISPNMVLRPSIQLFGDISEIKTELKNFKVGFVCLPSYLNWSITKRLLDEGVTVFCEKPPVINKIQLNELEASLKQLSTNYIAFGFNLQYDAGFIELAKRVKKAESGIEIIDCVFTKKSEGTNIQSWRKNKKLSGGGVLMDVGIHVLHLIDIITEGGVSPQRDTIHAILQKGMWDKYPNEWTSDVEATCEISYFSRMGININIHLADEANSDLFYFKVTFGNGEVIILNGCSTSSKRYCTLGHTSLSQYSSREGQIELNSILIPSNNNAYISQIIALKELMESRDREKIFNSSTGRVIRVLRALFDIYEYSVLETMRVEDIGGD